MDYENIILISHEDRSKDITRKSGDKITAIKPNLQDKVATKVAGMVDIVARVIADGDVRTLSFKTNEVIFGGGRLTVSTNEIPLDYDAFLEVYEEANKNAVAELSGEKPAASASTERKGRKKKEEPAEPAPKEEPQEETEPADAEPKEEIKEEPQEEHTEQEAPKTRKTRKKRGE